MRKGFTLIELTVVLAILGTIAGCSVLSFKYYKEVQNKMDADYYCNAVVSFINNSKMYCRENSCSAKISFDKIGNRMRLDEGLKIVRQLKFPSNITLFHYDTNREDNDIKIDNKGASSESGSITLMDNNSKPYRITMGVGTAYVENK